MKRLRLFAGPNGSGKSTIKNNPAIQPEWLGVQVNPDEIELELRTTGFIDLSRIGIEISPYELNVGYQSSNHWGVSELDSKTTFEMGAPNQLFLRTSNLTSYHASWIAGYFRDRLILEGKSLATESVMSHHSKIELLQQTERAGYRNYLYFVATSDEEINVDRVRLRVSLGGHDVPEQKIRERYHRSIALLGKALHHVYRGYVFDNSGAEPELIAERTPQGTVELRSRTIPQWFADAVWNQ